MFYSVQSKFCERCPSMIFEVHPLFLHDLWDYLGAEYIQTDIRLALQSHAIERRFNNWVFHALMDEVAQRVFRTVDPYCTPAHLHLSRRLQGALTLLMLRCVNKNLHDRCKDLLDKKDVCIHEFVCTSRTIHFPRNISPDIRDVLRSIRRNLERQQFLNCFRGGVSQHEEEQQRERICRLRLLEVSLDQFIFMNKAIALKVYHYERTLQS